MKPTTILFIALIAFPAFAHPVAKNESPVIERRKNHPHNSNSRPASPPQRQAPKPSQPHHHHGIHISPKVANGFKIAGEVLGSLIGFLRRDLNHRALFDKGHEIAVRRRSIDLEERDGHGHHAVHTAVTAAGIGLEIYDTFHSPSKREVGEGLSGRSINNDLQVRDWDGDELEAREVEARDFDDELEARDFDDELEVREFELEAREFDDDFLDARGLDESLDELD